MPASDADSDATVPLIRHVTVTVETSHQTSHYRRGRLNTDLPNDSEPLQTQIANVTLFAFFFKYEPITQLPLNPYND